MPIISQIYNPDDIEGLGRLLTVIVPSLIRDSNTNTGMFNYFEGTDNDSLIVRRNTNRKGGEVVFQRIHSDIGTTTVGNIQIEGKGESIEVTPCRIVTQLIRSALRLENALQEEIVTGKNWEQELYHQIKMQYLKLYKERVISSFIRAFGDNNALEVIPQRKQIFSFYEQYKQFMNTCGIDKLGVFNNGVSSSRLVFGKDDKDLKFNNNDTLGKVFASEDAMGDIEDGALSVTVLQKLVERAATGTNRYTRVQEAALSPFSNEKSFKFGLAHESWVLFTSPTGFQMLQKDPLWRSQYTAPIRQDQPQIIKGGAWAGMMAGVNVIVVPEFSRFEIRTNERRIIYSAFCGANAIGHVIAADPWYVAKRFDVDRVLEVYHNEWSAIKVIKFPSQNVDPLQVNNSVKVEDGIIHSFTYAPL